MIFGHNSNVTIGADTVHVQTEDRGVASALIETTVHWKGRVLHRRTNNYKDLLPLDAGKETALKARVDEQHHAVIEELRSGSLQLPLSKKTKATSTATRSVARSAAAALNVELTNARTWLAGKQATLQLVVRDGAGNPVCSATAKAHVEGAASPFESSAETSPAGTATLRFKMPKLSGSDPALVIKVFHNGARGNLRFQLRTKARP